MLKAGRRLRTWAMSMAATLAVASAAAAPATPEIAAWLAANTDMRAAQVVIAGPDHVYTLEPLSPPTSAGEVIVLVRTEAIGKDWSAANGSASWDAHLLFDCRNDRMREIRSAAYPGRNRQGSPKIEDARDGWTKPDAPEPAARLLAAACDPDFAWPLRTATTAARTPTPPPSLPSPLVLSAQTYAVQIARGPSAEGAQKALKAARKTLGPLSRELTDTTEVTSLGKARRYTVRLAGFRDAAAAAEACRKLVEAKQECFPWQETAEAPAAAEPPPPAKPSGYAVQIARGPSEEGAQKALKAARKTLGASGEKLIATAELSHVGSRRRYTALLSGFPSAADAARACATLTAAGQTCFALKASDAD